MPATRDAGTRQDTFVIRVVLDGSPLGIWDKKTGGALDSDELKYYPGGMRQAISLGGKKTTDNITLQRLYDRKDDHDKINTLFNAVGRGKLTISQKPMDPDGNEYGRPIIWVGTLKRVFVPDTDSEGNAAALVEIEATIAGQPSAR